MAMKVHGHENGRAFLLSSNLHRTAIDRSLRLRRLPPIRGGPGKQPRNGCNQVLGGNMRLVTTALAIALAGFGFVQSAQAQQITGAGATFPAPIYTKWAELAKKA